MMDETEVVFRKYAPLGLRIHSQFGERELSRLPPELDGRVDFRRP